MRIVACLCLCLALALGARADEASVPDGPLPAQARAQSELKLALRELRLPPEVVAPLFTLVEDLAHDRVKTLVAGNRPAEVDVLREQARAHASELLLPVLDRFGLTAAQEARILGIATDRLMADEEALRAVPAAEAGLKAALTDTVLSSDERGTAFVGTAELVAGHSGGAGVADEAVAALAAVFADRGVSEEGAARVREAIVKLAEAHRLRRQVLATASR